MRPQNELRRSFRPIVKAATIALAEVSEQETAKFPPIRFHDLRHSYASLALAAGSGAKVVSETLGHSSVAFRLDTYAHVLPGMQRAAADTMDRLFRVGG